MPITQPPKRHHVILVVEDDVVIRELLMEYLGDVGFEVLSAANADEARSIVETRGAIELVLTDINMPGSMDGSELAAWLQGHEPDVPVILVSGGAAGKTDPSPKRWFLRKPFELAAVETTIRKLLD